MSLTQQTLTALQQALGERLSVLEPFEQHVRALLPKSREASPTTRESGAGGASNSPHVAKHASNFTSSV
jgi:hypothetical protein